MKRFAMSVALVCVLSGATLAGNVPTTDYVPPPPPPGAGQTASSGQIPTTGIASPGQVPSTDLTGEMPTCGLSVLLTILAFAC